MRRVAARANDLCTQTDTPMAPRGKTVPGAAPADEGGHHLSRADQLTGGHGRIHLRLLAQRPAGLRGALTHCVGHHRQQSRFHKTTTQDRQCSVQQARQGNLEASGRLGTRHVIHSQGPLSNPSPRHPRGTMTRSVLAAAAMRSFCQGQLRHSAPTRRTLLRSSRPTATPAAGATAAATPRTALKTPWSSITSPPTRFEARGPADEYDAVVAWWPSAE